MYSSFCPLLLLLFALNSVNADYAIFKPPDQCDISEIQTTEIPWTVDEDIQMITKFRKHMLDGLRADAQVQRIWNSSPDSATVRRVYFKVMNREFYNNRDKVPAALANLISLGASLFDKLDKETYFECDAVSIAQYFISKGRDVDASVAQSYVNEISKAIREGDISTPDAEFNALVLGWEKFLKNYGYDVEDYQNDLIILFTSHLVVLHDKSLKK